MNTLDFYLPACAKFIIFFMEGQRSRCATPQVRHLGRAMRQGRALMRGPSVLFASRVRVVGESVNIVLVQDDQFSYPTIRCATVAKICVGHTHTHTKHRHRHTYTIERRALHPAALYAYHLTGATNTSGRPPRCRGHTTGARVREHASRARPLEKMRHFVFSSGKGD